MRREVRDLSRLDMSPAAPASSGGMMRPAVLGISISRQISGKILRRREMKLYGTHLLLLPKRSTEMTEWYTRRTPKKRLEAPNLVETVHTEELG